MKRSSNLEFVDEKLMKARQVGKVMVCLHWRKQLGGRGCFDVRQIHTLSID